MKILIIGGTGAMGTPLVEFCLNAKYETIVTTRKNRKSNNKLLKYLVLDAHSVEFEEYISDKKYDCIVDFMVYTENELLLTSSRF